MVVFTDLPIALLILFLMVPNIGFYVLPFLKSKRNFYAEFNEDLSPWQRSVLAIALSLGLLFFLALSHSVNLGYCPGKKNSDIKAIANWISPYFRSLQAH